MQEKIDLIKTLDDETGVEESLETRMRVIGNKSYTDKVSITDGQEKEEIITEMDDDELENFKKEWKEKDESLDSRVIGNWSLTFKLFETFACIDIENYPKESQFWALLIEADMVRVLKEMKDLAKIFNDETGVEESHSKVFGDKSYTLTAKLFIHN